MSKQTNIPQLRFPEFEGEWEKKKLVEVADKIQDGTHFSPQVFDKGDYLYLTSKNVKNGYLELSNAQYISKESHESIYKRCDVRNGDVLITKDGTIGQTCVNELDEQFSLLSSVAFIRPKDEFSNYFIYQLLVSPKGQKEIDSQIAGQALKRVTLTKINIFEYFFPKLPEQTKIASFLTAVDEKIQALKKKHRLLEQYKKGVMQMLFCLHHDSLDLHDDPDSQGEQQEKNQGNHENQKKSRFRQLRFKDKNGNDFPEWEVKKLGEVATFFSGGTPLTTKREYFDGKIPFIRSGEINSNKTEQFITELGLKNSSAKMVEIGDILYALYGATSGEVGISKINGAINQAVLCIKSNQNHYFIYSFLKFEKDNIIKTYLQGGQGNLSAEIVKKIEIPLPSLKEQTAIANFLSALDEKINHTKQQIEKMEVWKKGLLQKMFV